MMTLIKKTSAWLPIAMSGAALALIFGYISINGIQKDQGDEKLIARLFQILLAGQIPVIGYFVVKWFPEHKRKVLQMIFIQILAALVPFLIVFFLEL